MSSEDDNFIREVNEELRSDAASAIWKKYGKIIIGLAVAIIVGVAGNVGYDNWRDGQAAASGDIFLEGLTQARDGQQDDALATFKQLEESGYGAYPVLARLRAATVLADKGDAADAIDMFNAVAADSSVPDAIRDIAKIRAGYLIVDYGTYDEASALVEVLTDTENAMRHSAREILGLAAFKAGDLTQARQWFDLIAADTATPGQIADRGQIILDLISSRTSAS